MNKTTGEERGTLLLKGSLGWGNVDALRRQLLDHIGAMAGSPEPVRVDLSGVPDLDTAAIQVLISARRTVAQAGKQLQCVAANERVRDRFRLTGTEFLLEPLAT
ncbi:MAG: STAS domain-containing protein [Magnetococcus sp. MYC-9]